MAGFLLGYAKDNLKCDEKLLKIVCACRMCACDVFMILFA